jgi:hypothetical protein
LRRTTSVVATLLALSAMASAAESPRDASASSAGAVSLPVAPPPPHEFLLGSVQLVAGYAAEVGGVAGALAIGLSPKGFGIRSDASTLVFVGVLAPALAGGAVCATGLFSRWYRGRCTTTLLGAYLGAAVGGLLGIALAPKPGPDDTAEFVSSITGIIGLLAFAPVGAVIGYHAGKQEIPPPTPSRPPSVSVAAPHAPPTVIVGERHPALGPIPRLMLPVLSLTW